MSAIVKKHSFDQAVKLEVTVHDKVADFNAVDDFSPLNLEIKNDLRQDFTEFVHTDTPRDGPLHSERQQKRRKRFITVKEAVENNVT